jgi:hypothetical protein
VVVLAHLVVAGGPVDSGLAALVLVAIVWALVALYALASKWR